MSIFESLIISSSDNDILLKPENDDGNIEYKLRLDQKGTFRIKKLISQMNGRMEEGKEMTNIREAHYVLGINDDGTSGHLSVSEMDVTYEIFTQVVEMCDSVIVESYRNTYGDSDIVYAKIQKIEKRKINEFNIAFVGPTQHGKTTTISHLVYGQHDDGKGYSRKLIYKYAHEKVTGITSSTKKELIGLKNNTLINYSTGIESSWETIVEMSDKVFNLIDLPGDLKYSRTTLFGLTSHRLDAILIVINLNKLNDEESKKIIKFYELYAENLNIPYKFIVTHCDDPNTCLNNQNEDEYIYISNMRSVGFNKIIEFLNTLKLYETPKCALEKNIPSFIITKIFFVPDSGNIYSGVMKYGNLKLHQNVYLTDGGSTFSTTIKTIHKKQINSDQMFDGESGTMQLDIDGSVVPEINKHMIITTKKHPLYNSLNFELIDNINFIDCNFEKLHGKTILITLFVDNNICSGNGVIVYDKIKQTTIFQIALTNQHIIPYFSAGFKQTIGFVKNCFGIFLGKIYL